MEEHTIELDKEASETKTLDAQPEVIFADDVDGEICGCVVYVRRDGPYTIYKGTDWGRLSIVGPGGTWIAQQITPGHTYRLERGAGWNCSVPPR